MKHFKHADTGAKPALDKGLFWDWRYDDINWQQSCRSIIERVLERGTPEDYKEIIRFYGMPVIIKTLKEGIKFLPDHTIAEASYYFNIRKEDMACYKRKCQRKGQWI